MSRPDAPTGTALAGTTLHLGHRLLETPYGPFDLHLFRDLARASTAMAIVRGDPQRATPLLARVHSSCVTSECLAACDCDCAEQLEGALAAMAQHDRGVLFYLMQEGRGAGLTAKARDRMIVQASGHRLNTFEAFAEMGLPADLRRYEAIAPIARWLGIRAPLRLLTNNPAKAEAVAAVLHDEKIEIECSESIQGPDSPFNADYLNAKQRSGHALDRPGPPPGMLAPGRVEVEPPGPALDAPHLLSMARYLLPIAFTTALVTGPESGGARRADGYPARAAIDGSKTMVEWFPLRVVLDLRSGRETILLSRPVRSGGLAAPARPVSKGGGLHRLQLIDRLPAREARGRWALRVALQAMRRSQEGRALDLPADSPEASDTLAIDFGDMEADAADERSPSSSSLAAMEARRQAAEEILAARWPERADDPDRLDEAG